jgi:ribonuclease J
VSHPHPGLGDPPALPRDGLRIVALGGLGEIGRNMTVFEHAGRLLVVDCGVLFPEPDQPGVDLILPDFSAIEDRLGDIEAIVLTHAHEDHIGGVPYLLRERADIPLVGSKLTLGLIRSKLTEHRITPETAEVVAGTTHRFGPFELEFFAVNHSIPDALAVGIRTRAGVVLHTGDFKMDQLPLDGRLTDLGGFARLGATGVDLLMADSTNAEVPGIVTSERDIAPVLAEVFAAAGQRIIVACFSSHVHRVQQVLDTAAAHGRKVALVGRSMVRNMGVARDLGYLHVPQVPGGLIVELREAEEMPPENIVLISTGSQGEPMSALSRMAGRDHPIRIAEGDTVVLASSLVPGNETAVSRIINDLTRLGARVVHKGNALVHVSGHAPAGELLYVLNLVRPRNFIPVHGEWRHLRAHAELAAKAGVPEKNIVIAEDGVVVDLVDGRASVVGKVPAGYRDLAEGPADPGRGGLPVGGRGDRLHERQDRRGAGDPRARFRYRRVRVRRGPAADRGGTDAGRGGRDDRRVPAQPACPADRGALGERELPPPADDHSADDRGLTRRHAGGAVCCRTGNPGYGGQYGDSCAQGRRAPSGRSGPPAPRGQPAAAAGRPGIFRRGQRPWRWRAQAPAEGRPPAGHRAQACGQG